jgi:hypothetical protein
VDLLITVLLSFLIFVGLFVLFYRLKKPIYQLSKENLISLFELLLSGQASEDDWYVFLEISIRHDPFLEDIRAQCINLAEGEVLSSSKGVILSEKATQEVERMLRELRLDT